MILFGECSRTDKLALRYVQNESKGVNNYNLLRRLGKYGFLEGPKRNEEMLSLSTHLLAFLSKESKGTRSAIGIAIKKGLNVVIIDV